MTPFARALAYYLGGGFALTLLCALSLFDSSGAPTSSASSSRRALAFSALGVLHPVIAATAYVLASDVGTRTDDSESPGRTRLAAVTSLGISTAAMLGVLVATADL